MKKLFKIVLGIIGVFVLMGIGAAMFGGGNSDSSTKVSKTATKAENKAVPATTQTEQKQEKKVYAFGEDISFASGLNVKVIGTTETNERNQFEDPTKHVIIVNAEITNTTSAQVTVTSNDFNIIDTGGFQGKTYAGGDQITQIAPNSKAAVKMQYAIDGSGPYKVIRGDATWQ